MGSLKQLNLVACCLPQPRPGAVRKTRLSWVIGTLWRSTALAALIGVGSQVEAASLEFEALLVLGTDASGPPKGKDYKPLASEVSQKFPQLPVARKNYFEVKRIAFVVPQGGTIKVPLSAKCQLGATYLDRTTAELSLIGNGQKVTRPTLSPRGSGLVVFGGGTEKTNSWLVVVRVPSHDTTTITAPEAVAHADLAPATGIPFPRPGEKVSRVYPDGLLVECSGGAGLRKVKFSDLPESIQQQYRYDPQKAAQYEADQARVTADFRTRQIRAEAQARARQVALVREAANQYQEKIAVLAQIVSDYHKSHTYSMADRFVCGDMACDVWNMVKTKGIEAKIEVGNVERDITSLREADHAWVMAETAPGKWLALEATAGHVVYPNDNPRYYWGWSFDSPRQFKERYYGHP